MFKELIEVLGVDVFKACLFDDFCPSTSDNNDTKNFLILEVPYLILLIYIKN